MNLTGTGAYGLPNLLWTLLLALNVVCLLHALYRRDWLWAAFLAIGVFLSGGGLFVTVFYTFSVLVPSLQGSGTRTRRAVRQTVQEAAEAVKSMETRIQEAQAALARSDTLAHRTALASLLARARRLEEAQATLAPLLGGIYRDDPLVLLTSAGLDLAQEQPAAAEAKLQRVELQTSASTRTQALTLLAEAQARQGKATEAEQTYHQAIQGATTEEPRARYAEFLVEQGRHSEAQTLLDRLLQIENEATPLYRRQEREWFELAGRLRRQLRQL